MFRSDTSRGVTSVGYLPRCHLRGLSPRCHLQWLPPEVSPPMVTSRGVTSNGYLPRCHLQWLPPEVSPPKVTSRGVTSKGYRRGVTSNGYLPRCHLRWLPPKVSPPTVASQGVTSKIKQPRLLLIPIPKYDPPFHYIPAIEQPPNRTCQSQPPGFRGRLPGCLSQQRNNANDPAT